MSKERKIIIMGADTDIEQLKAVAKEFDATIIIVNDELGPPFPTEPIELVIKDIPRHEIIRPAKKRRASQRNNPFKYR